MDAYLIALLPILLTAFLGVFGWVLNRMVKLSEAVATCVEKVEAINVEQRHIDERIDTLVLSQFKP